MKPEKAEQKQEKVSYIFKRTQQFRNSFDELSPDNQDAAREAFKIFKANPFDQRLNPHKINRLSSLYHTTVRSVTIKGDLKAVFLINGNNVISLDIGTHAIYKG